MGYQKLGRIVEQVETTATAAGTTTLINTSKQNQTFTGTLTQDVALPDATTCPNGTLFRFKNESTQAITIEYDDNTTLVLIQSGGDLLVVLRDNSTSNGVWTQYVGSGSGGQAASLKIKARKSSNQNIATGSTTTIIFDTEDEDNTGSYNNATGEFTVPAGYAGFYLIESMIDINNTNNTGQRTMFVYVNGSSAQVLSYVANSFVATETYGRGTGLQLDEGDVVTIRLNQNSGVTLGVGGSGNDYNYLNIVKYDLAPSTNQAIVVHATLVSVSLTASTTITGWTKIRDTQNILNTGTGEITILTPGDYFIAVNLLAASTNNVTKVKVNGTDILSQQVGDVGNGFTGAHGILPGLQTGDIITVQQSQSNTTSADAAENTLSLFKINDVSENAPIAVIVEGSSTSLTIGGVTVVPTNVLKDTANALSGGTFTAPVGGFYQCGMYLQGGSVGYSAGDVLSAYVEVNAVVYPLGVCRVQAAGTHSLVASGALTVYANEGETIVFKGNSSGTVTASAFNGSIIKVG